MPSTAWTDDGQDETQQAGDYAVAEVTRYFSRGLERVEVTYAAERIVTYNTTDMVQDLTETTVLPDGRKVDTVTHEYTGVLTPEGYSLYDIRVTLKDSNHVLCVPKDTLIACYELVRWDVSETTNFSRIDPETGERDDDGDDAYQHDWIGYTVLRTQAEAEALMNRTAKDLSASVFT